MGIMTRETFSLLIVVGFILMFTYFYFTAKSGKDEKTPVVQPSSEMELQPGIVRCTTSTCAPTRAGSIDDAATVEKVVPDKADEILATVETNEVTDEEQATAIEGLTAGPKVVDVEVDDIDTVFKGVDMALMPNVRVGKQIRWLRQKMVAFQKKAMNSKEGLVIGTRGVITFDTAAHRLTDYKMMLGEKAAAAVASATGKSLDPATS